MSWRGHAPFLGAHRSPARAGEERGRASWSNRALTPYMLEAMANACRRPPSARPSMRPPLLFGMPMGPIELADQVRPRYLPATSARAFKGEPRSPDGPSSHSLLRQQGPSWGELGRKTGKGFYTLEERRGPSRETGTHRHRQTA